MTLKKDSEHYDNTTDDFYYFTAQIICHSHKFESFDRKICLL